MTVELKPRIMVFGVGGAGGNAVNNMIESGLQGVDFVVANTDAQALVHSKADQKIQLGASTTEGLGAGAQPSVGSAAAEESLAEISAQLEGAHMAFIAAGMGGGTGTGAAPVIARAAKEKGVLTVGVVTKPFEFEGKRRMQIADTGIDELRHHVDTLIIIPNQNLFRIANANTTFADAFNLADEVLLDGVRGITDLMVMPGLINLDFADVRTVMSEMGAAMMGTGEAGGEQRALKAAQSAIANPLLDDISMKGAKGVLINITGGYDMTLYEVDEAANEVRREVDPDAQIILGSTFDSTLDGKIRVSVVATGIMASAYATEARAAAPAAAAASLPEVTVAEDVPPQAATIITRSRPADIEDIEDDDMVMEDGEAVAASPVSDALYDGDDEDADATDAPQSEEVAQSDASDPEPQIERPVINARPVAAAEDDVALEAHEPAFHVQADDASTHDESPQPESSTPADDAKSGGFSGLFGWRRQSTDHSSEPAVPSLDADAYEDDELEIPAFLRRSATN